MGTLEKMNRSRENSGNKSQLHNSQILTQSNLQNGSQKSVQNSVQNGSQYGFQEKSLNGYQNDTNTVTKNDQHKAKKIQDAFILEQAKKLQLEKAEIARKQQNLELQQNLMNDQAVKQTIENSLTQNGQSARTASFDYKRSRQRPLIQQPQFVQVQPNNVITLSPSQMKELQALAQNGGISLQQLQTIQASQTPKNLNKIFMQNNNSSQNGQYKF